MAEQDKQTTEKKEKYDPKENMDLQGIALKRLYKNVEEQVDEVYAQHVNSPEPTDFKELLGNLLEAYPKPEAPAPAKEAPSQKDILSQILELSTAQVPTGEEKSRIGNFIRGEGFVRTPVMEDLGVDDATKILQIQSTQATAAKSEANKARIEANKAGMEQFKTALDVVRMQMADENVKRKIPKEQLDMLQSLLDIAPKLDALLGGQEGESLERDIQGNLTTKGLEQEIRTKKLATASIERQEKFRKAESSMTSYVNQFERSEQEIISKYGPGLLEAGVGGASQRILGKGAVNFDQLPITAAFIKQKQAIANQTARNVEGGRVTDLDRKIYADVLANALDGSSTENAELLSVQLIDMGLMLTPDERILSITPQIESFMNSNSPTLRRAGELAQKTLDNKGNKGELQYDEANKMWARVYPDGSYLELGPDWQGQPGFEMYRDPAAKFPQKEKSRGINISIGGN